MKINKINVVALLLLFTSLSFAGTVLKVKDAKVLLNVSDMPDVQAGTDVYSLDANGKKRSLVRVKQVKDGKAVADLLKGTAEVGQTLKIKVVAAGGSSATGAAAAAGAAAPTGGDRTPKPKGFLGKFLHRGTGVGLMAGIAENSMSLTASDGINSEPLSMSGMSFNLVGFYDYDFSPALTVRGVVGLETFSVTGSTQQVQCNGGNSCMVGFNYLAGEAHAHYNILHKTHRVWVGAGFDFLFAVSKSSTVPNLDSSSATNQMLDVEVGGDYSLGNGTFIPVSLEYGLFPGSSTVTASSIIIRGGYAWRF